MLHRLKLLTVLLGMSLALVCGSAFYSPVAAQELPDKLTTHKIEAVGIGGLQMLTTVEFPEGHETPLEGQIGTTHPDKDRLEILEVDWDGSGSCEINAAQDVMCTGEITYLKFVFRYTYSLFYSGQYFGIVFAEMESEPVHLVYVIEYPEALTVVETSQEPSAQEPGQLMWTVSPMTEFVIGVAFFDPRISAVFLPLLSE